MYNIIHNQRTQKHATIVSITMCLTMVNVGEFRLSIIFIYDVYDVTMSMCMRSRLTWWFDDVTVLFMTSPRRRTRRM